jgi:hypothetical protein
MDQGPARGVNPGPFTGATFRESEDRDREATTGRFPLALFVVAEVLCTGALIGSVILWG